MLKKGQSRDQVRTVSIVSWLIYLSIVRISVLNLNLQKKYNKNILNNITFKVSANLTIRSFPHNKKVYNFFLRKKKKLFFQVIIADTTRFDRIYSLILF